MRLPPIPSLKMPSLDQTLRKLNRASTRTPRPRGDIQPGESPQDYYGRQRVQPASAPPPTARGRADEYIESEKRREQTEEPWFIKAAKPFGDVFFGILRILDIPRSIVAGAVGKLVGAEGTGEGGKVWGSDILRKAGVPDGIVQGVLGFGLDRLMDPLSWLGKWWGSAKIGKLPLAAKAAKQASEGAKGVVTAVGAVDKAMDVAALASHANKADDFSVAVMRAVKTLMPNATAKTAMKEFAKLGRLDQADMIRRAGALATKFKAVAPKLGAKALSGWDKTVDLTDDVLQAMGKKAGTLGKGGIQWKVPFAPRSTARTLVSQEKLDAAKQLLGRPFAALADKVPAVGAVGRFAGAVKRGIAEKLVSRPASLGPNERAIAEAQVRSTGAGAGVATQSLVYVPKPEQLTKELAKIAKQSGVKGADAAAVRATTHFFGTADDVLALRELPDWIRTNPKALDIVQRAKAGFAEGTGFTGMQQVAAGTLKRERLRPAHVKGILIPKAQHAIKYGRASSSRMPETVLPGLSPVGKNDLITAGKLGETAKAWAAKEVGELNAGIAKKLAIVDTLKGTKRLLGGPTPKQDKLLKGLTKQVSDLKKKITKVPLDAKAAARFEKNMRDLRIYRPYVEDWRKSYEAMAQEAGRRVGEAGLYRQISGMGLNAKQVKEAAQQGHRTTLLSDVAHPAAKSLADRFRKMGIKVPRMTVPDAEFAVRRLAYQGEEFNAAMKALLDLQGKWKGFALAAPAYHIRNAITNFVSNLMGRSGFHYKEAGQLQRMFYNAFKDPKAMEAFRRASPVTIKGLGTVRPSDLLDILHRNHILGSGLFAVEGAKAMKWSPLQLNRMAGQIIEDNARIAHFLGRLQRGDTIEAAAESVSRFLFNYGDLSKTMQKAKAFFPFITWPAKATQLIAQEGKRAPGILTALPQLQHAIQQATPEDQRLPDSAMPPWQRGRLAFQVPGLPGTTAEWLTDVTPFGGPADVGNLPEFLERQLTPLVKTPYELAVNRSLFTQRPIEQYEGERGKILGIPMPKKAEHALRVWRPATDVTRLMRPDVETARKIASALGVSVATVDRLRAAGGRQFELLQQIAAVKRDLRKALQFDDDDEARRLAKIYMQLLAQMPKVNFKQAARETGRPILGKPDIAALAGEQP